MYCRNCGKQVLHGGIYCSHCGAKIVAPASNSSKPTVEEQAARPLKASGLADSIKDLRNDNSTSTTRKVISIGLLILAVISARLVGYLIGHSFGLLGIVLVVGVFVLYARFRSTEKSAMQSDIKDEAEKKVKTGSVAPARGTRVSDGGRIVQSVNTSSRGLPGIVYVVGALIIVIVLLGVWVSWNSMDGYVDGTGRPITPTPFVPTNGRLVSVPRNSNRYGMLVYAVTLSSGTKVETGLLGKFPDAASCTAWLESRKSQNNSNWQLEDAECQQSGDDGTELLESAILMRPGVRTYLAFTDENNVSVRMVFMSGSADDSTTIALLYKKQFEDAGGSVQIVYHE